MSSTAELAVASERSATLAEPEPATIDCDPMRWVDKSGLAGPDFALAQAPKATLHANHIARRMLHSPRHRAGLSRCLNKIALRNVRVSRKRRYPRTLTARRSALYFAGTLHSRSSLHP
jgi:hypothetical protein